MKGLAEGLEYFPARRSLTRQWRIYNGNDIVHHYQTFLEEDAGGGPTPLMASFLMVTVDRTGVNRRSDFHLKSENELVVTNGAANALKMFFNRLIRFIVFIGRSETTFLVTDIRDPFLKFGDVSTLDQVGGVFPLYLTTTKITLT